MNDCQFRNPNEDFCKDCPLRPVLSECGREGFVARVVSPSRVQRIGVFILSSLSLFMIPVVLRNVLRLQVEGDVPPTLATALLVAATVFGVVVALAALIGLYAAVFGGKKPRQVA